MDPNQTVKELFATIFARERASDLMSISFGRKMSFDALLRRYQADIGRFMRDCTSYFSLWANILPSKQRVDGRGREYKQMKFGGEVKFLDCNVVEQKINELHLLRQGSVVDLIIPASGWWHWNWFCTVWEWGWNGYQTWCMFAHIIFLQHYIHLRMC